MKAQLVIRKFDHRRKTFYLIEDSDGFLQFCSRYSFRNEELTVCARCPCRVQGKPGSHTRNPEGIDTAPGATPRPLEGHPK